MVFLGGWVSNGMTKNIKIRYSVAQFGQTVSTVLLTPEQSNKSGRLKKAFPLTFGPLREAVTEG
ncbi:hypothetical protein RUM43_012689 [Polyplax serrata]|uniref:Uncharacterized protein n=1 Tax=Polyplax serrata TaxID=468196 RepID=A0AAN8NYB2_POLSC